MKTPNIPLVPIQLSLIAGRAALFAADHFGVTVADVFGETKPSSIARARMFALALAYDWMPNHFNTKQLGKAFNKERSNISHARARMKEMCDTDPDVAAWYARVAEWKPSL